MGLLEQPLIILFSGAFACAVASAVWLQTRQRGALLALIAMLALTLIGLLVERLVVTDAEQVRGTLQRIASLMEQNDVAAVLQQISAASPALRQEAQTTLSRVTVEKISIKRNLRVQVVHRTDRKSAEAKFNAVATVRDGSGLAGPHVIPRFSGRPFSFRAGRLEGDELRDLRSPRRFTPEARADLKCCPDGSLP